jgi:Fe-Mn family superoxide dismutase
LVKDAKDGKLSILTTSNAETPSGTGKIPLLTADVWEHTYYVDYLNRRADYLKAFMDKVHWDFVAAQYDALTK